LHGEIRLTAEALVSGSWRNGDDDAVNRWVVARDAGLVGEKMTRKCQ
jgi:hypothetical protein